MGFSQFNLLGDIFWFGYLDWGLHKLTNRGLLLGSGDRCCFIDMIIKTSRLRLSKTRDYYYFILYQISIVMNIKASQLYTPVEIPKARLDQPVNLRPYSIQKYRENPFQQSKSSVESLTDQKKKIIHWLRSMSIGERQEKAAFISKDFTTLVRTMHDRRRRYHERSFRIAQDIESQGCLLNSRRMLIIYGKDNVYRLDNCAFDQAEEQLIQNVVVQSSNQIYDTITLSDKFLTNLERLFQIFQIVEDGVSNDLSLEEYRSLEAGEPEAYFYRKDETDHYKKTFGKWLVEVIKKKLWCQYYKNRQEVVEVKKPRQKKKFNRMWKDLLTAQRKQCLGNINLEEIQEMIRRQKESKRIISKILPHLEPPSGQQIFQYFEQLTTRNELELYEHLSQCSLDQTYRNINLVRYPLLLQLKEQKKKLPVKQTNKSEVKKKKHKKKKQKMTKEASGSQTTEATITNQLDQKLPLLSEMTPTKTESMRQPIRKEPKTQAKMVKEEEKPKPIYSTPQQKSKKMRRYVELDETRRPKQKATSVASNETYQTVNRQDELTEEEILERQRMLQKLYTDKQRQDLVEVADSISEIANSYSPYRLVAFNRIQYLLSALGISIKIFGSCATGLALANSDIDLAVDPSILNYFYTVFGNGKEKVCMALSWIMKLIEGRSWISNLKLITTATVPILKFEVNPNIPFEENSKDHYLNTKEKEKHKKVLIKIDLTIESFYGMDDGSNCNHLGIMATNNMKEWMAHYPTLYIVSIVLKDLLKKTELNNIYKGGISSYSLIVMIIAYLHHKGLVEEKDPAIVLYGFLDFMTKELKYQEVGFDISCQNPTFPFFKPEYVLEGKVQVRDPLNGKVVTGNSYQFQKILNELHKLSRHRERIREDLHKFHQNPALKLPQSTKYFTRNFLQEHLTDL